MIGRMWRRFLRFIGRHGPEIAVIIMIVVFMVVYFADDIFYTIPAGSVGVLWYRFFGGTVLTRYVGEGLHVIAPWDKIYIYDTRLQQLEQDFDVLSADGLKMTVNIAYRFQAIPATVPALHQYVGPNYVSVLITTEIGARARDVFSRNTPEEIFSDRRIQIQREILQNVQSDLRQTFSPMAGHPIDFVKLDDVLIRGITLPPEVEAAINRKEEQKQLNLEYDYRLLREAKETERKRIEAQGIREFQDIVSSGITDSYLRWKGIEATLELARSNNAKIVIVGGGKGGLPIILGNMDSGPAPMSPRPPHQSSEEGELPNGGDSFPMLPSVGDGGNTPPLPPTPSGPNKAKDKTAQRGRPSATTPNNSPAMAPPAPNAGPPAPQPAPTPQAKRNR
jgi:regulator of protease activity HflC (stomatin/prohibitin superfamily)